MYCQKLLFEDNRRSHDGHVHQSGVVETRLNPRVVEGSELAREVFVDDLCPNRKNDSADDAIDEVLEQDRNDEVEMDVLDVMEDDIEDSENDYIENVVVIASRNQRENVEVVGRGGSCWNGCI